MLQQTKGIVLKTIPYSETSLIVSVFTEHFGLQQYLQKGARRVGKKGGSSQQVYFQAGALLSMVVYHRHQANFQLIKEVSWHHIYQTVYQQVSRNAVSVFMIELLAVSLKQPEPLPELFEFVLHQLQLLDEAAPEVAALMPSWFILQLGTHFGFQLDTSSLQTDKGFDLYQGTHPHIMQDYWVDGWLAETIALLLEQRSAITLYRIRLSKDQRKALLNACLAYYYYHQPDAVQLKSLPVLEVLMQ